MNFAIDHIGIAVMDLEDTLIHYQQDFGFKLEHREKVESQNTEIVFLKAGPTLIELLAPLSNSGPVAKFIKKRGPGLHHICYAVDNIVDELKRLSSLGYKLIDEVPRAGAHNSLVAFIHPKSCNGVLVELAQRLS